MMKSTEITGKRRYVALSLSLLAFIASAAAAHDTWVQTNTSRVRVGDVVYIDLMLGNHGNDHRDFRITGKAPLEGSTIEVIAPDGTRQDLGPSLEDRGLGEKEGYWSARYRPREPGLFLVAQTSDRVVSYAPQRSIKSAKTFFLAGRSLDRDEPASGEPGRVLGHALELVPQSDPVGAAGKGEPLVVKLLFEGKPLAGGRVSLIPRGVTLAEGFDEHFERRADEQGVVSFEPGEANHYLVAAHHRDDRKGEGYESTKYSATLTVYVPDR